jgi:hypothetical protein
MGGTIIPTGACTRTVEYAGAYRIANATFRPSEQVNRRIRKSTALNGIAGIDLRRIIIELLPFRAGYLSIDSKETQLRSLAHP